MQGAPKISCSNFGDVCWLDQKVVLPNKRRLIKIKSFRISIALNRISKLLGEKTTGEIVPL